MRITEEKMLQVDAVAKESPIHGLGLFAQLHIPEGTVIWRFEPPFDIEFTEEELRRLTPPAQKQVLYYSTFEAERQKYLLSGDDDRFINHSDSPNAIDIGHEVVAVREILHGDEITLDYRTIGCELKTK
jgi:SET domain-containing protein